MNLSILYVLYEIVRYVFKISFSSFINTRVSISYLVMCWYKSMDEYWYLYGLIVTYVLILLLLYVLKQLMKESNEEQQLKVVLLVCSAISLLFVMLNPLSEWSGKRAMSIIMFFFIGLLICKNGMINVQGICRIIEGLTGLLVIILITILDINVPLIVTYIAGGLLQIVFLAFLRCIWFHRYYKEV